MEQILQVEHQMLDYLAWAVREVEVEGVEISLNPLEEVGAFLEEDY